MRKTSLKPKPLCFARLILDWEPMKTVLAIAVALGASSAAVGAQPRCAAQGEPVQWVADYCMLKMETDDEIAVSGCIEEERKKSFPSNCASNLHFKTRMCALMVRNGTKSGTVGRCVKDPAFKGRVVGAGGVGA